jgi:hypothetical protein
MRTKYDFLWALALLPALATGALGQAPQSQGAYSVPLAPETPGYDFRITPRAAVRRPEWLQKSVTLELSDAPSLEAVEVVLKLAGVASRVEGMARGTNFATQRTMAAKAAPGASLRRARLAPATLTVEEALQAIARSAQVDLEFYRMTSGAWRVVVREADPVAQSNRLYIGNGVPQQMVVTGDVARALQAADVDAMEINRRGSGNGGGRGGGMGPGVPVPGANLGGVRSLPVVQNLTRLPAPGISEKRVSVELRRRTLRECFDALLKPTGLTYVLEADIPPQVRRTLALEAVPLDLALDVLCASGEVGWSAELREGKPFIKIGRRYALPR